MNDKGTEPGLSYFAYGRRSDMLEGFGPLVTAPRAMSPNLDVARDLDCFSAATGIAAAQRPAALFADGPDLTWSVIAYLGPRWGGPAIAIQRSQMGLKRRGNLLEFLSSTGAAPSAGWMSLVQAFARQPTESDVLETSRKWSTRMSAIGDADLLQQIVRAGWNKVDVLVRAVSGVVAMIAGAAERPHVRVVLCDSDAHLTLPIAVVLNEILPAADKPNGFAVATFVVKQMDPHYSWDWVILAASREEVLPQGREEIVLDLRAGLPAMAHPAASAVARIIPAGHDAIRPLGAWIEKAGGLRAVSSRQWEHLDCSLMLRPGSTAPTVARLRAIVERGGWKYVGVDAFLDCWQKMTDQERATCGDLIKKLQEQALDNPPLLGWLAQESVAGVAGPFDWPGLLSGISSRAMQE